jgi:hypothetical protein
MNEHGPEATKIIPIAEYEALKAEVERLRAELARSSGSAAQNQEVCECSHSRDHHSPGECSIRFCPCFGFRAARSPQDEDNEAGYDFPDTPTGEPGPQYP